MSAIKQVWITEHDSGLVALSIESSHVYEKHLRVKAFEAEYPEIPNARNPLRHVVHISLLDEEDMKKILVAICEYLKYDIRVD
jgi:hypothetical protein